MEIMKHHKNFFRAFVVTPLVITLLIGCQSDGEVVERPDQSSFKRILKPLMTILRLRIRLDEPSLKPARLKRENHLSSKSLF